MVRPGEFNERVKRQAFARAEARCECRRRECGHVGRCNAKLTDGWVPRHNVPAASGGASVLANCIAVCSSCDDAIRRG